MSTEPAEAGLDLPPDWLGQYLREHVVHAVVVVLIVAYPFLYDALVGAFGLTAEMFLLRPRAMISVLILGLFAMSFDFISGYTSYLSFGHGAFFGIGAYFVVLGYNGQLPLVPAELPFMALMLIGAVLAVLAALIVGLVSFRLSGVYFAMITLGFAELLYIVSQQWNFITPGDSDPSSGVAAGSPPDVELFTPQIGVPFVEALQIEIGTFGDQTLFGLDVSALLLFDVVQPPVVVSYLAIGAVVLVCYLAMQRIIHSPFGRVMIAIRENEQRAKAVGYNTFWFKMGAFMISAFFGGIAGGLLVAWEGTVDPASTFFFLVTGFALIATIIGGIRTLAGPFFGYIFLEAVEEFLAREGSGGGLQPYLEAAVPDSVLSLSLGGLSLGGAIDSFMTGHADFYAGIIFVVFVLYAPIGMLGTIRLRLGTTAVAKYVSQRLGSDADDGSTDDGAAAEQTDGDDPAPDVADAEAGED